MKSQIIALALAGVAGPALAASAAVPVADSSFVEANGQRVQQLSIVVPASAHETWQAFTTDAGFTRWAVPVAHITLANGGMMESSYLTTGKVGDPDNIRNRIDAYLPERLLVIHNEHVPKGAPFDPVLIATLRTVVTLEPVDAAHTRVTLSQVGYGAGPGYDLMYRHFLAGNAEELQDLASSFVTGPVNWKAQAESVRQSVNKTKN